MSSSPTSTPEGPGSAAGAPNLPAGFTDTFTSRYVDTGAVRLHAVVQDQQRAPHRLTMPVLAIGGAASFGEHVGEALGVVADDVRSVVIPGTGHFVAEESPDEVLAALTPFLAPYRDSSTVGRPVAAAVR